jgi:anti-sigma regulatory factor (Ser/Thr protein kinase)
MDEQHRHEALPYSGHDQFLACCRALADDGRSRGDRLLFLLAAGKLAGLREVLDPAAGDMAFVATEEHGRNPARLTSVLDGFRADAGGRRCLGVQEPLTAGQPAARAQEARLNETLLNTGRVRAWPMSFVCLYDAAALGEDALADMRRSHPAIRGVGANTAYDPAFAQALFRSPLDDPPPHAVTLDVVGTDLTPARQLVAGFARRSGIPEGRAEDLVLAANEVVTNSIRHGGGWCRVAVWEDGGVVCDVRDSGVIGDCLVGRLSPPPTAPHGRGLWLANHLCDLVQIRSSQAGTVVRLHVER